MGIARAVGAILFSVVIGVLMHFFFRKEEAERQVMQMAMMEEEVKRPLWQNALYFASMVAILVFANWGAPQTDSGVWAAIFGAKWMLTSAFSVALGVMLVRWFGVQAWKVGTAAIPVVLLAVFFPGQPLLAFTAGVIGLSAFTSTDDGEVGDWFSSSWGFAKQILPLLLIGVLVSGFLLGGPGQEGLIPSAWVSAAVGGNSPLANFLAAFLGAFMYFTTLTEVPILQGLLGSGMGQGPALALLLAGPALSLPNMLVIRSVIGTKKTAVYVLLVVVAATLSGLIYGTFFA